MTLQWYHFLIICPAVFIAGFIDAIAGGGGLITLPMYLVAGVPAHLALGTNKMGSSMGTAVATLRYAKSGFIPWKKAAFGVVGGLIGSHLGANLALIIDDQVFKMLLLVILPVTAFYVMRGKSLTTEKEPLSDQKTILLICVISLCIGVYDGFYGPGTGTFLILLLTGIAHVKLQEANGITKAINLSTNISALGVYLVTGNVLLPLGLTAGVFSIAGNYLGARFFEKKGAVSVKPVMILVLVLFFAKVLKELLFG